MTIFSQLRRKTLNCFNINFLRKSDQFSVNEVTFCWLSIESENIRHSVFLVTQKDFCNFSFDVCIQDAPKVPKVMFKIILDLNICLKLCQKEQ